MVDLWIFALYIVHDEPTANWRHSARSPKGERPIATGSGETAWHEPRHDFSDRERHRERDRRAQAHGVVRGTWPVDSRVRSREASDAVRAERGKSWLQDPVLRFSRARRVPDS